MATMFHLAFDVQSHTLAQCLGAEVVQAFRFPFQNDAVLPAKPPRTSQFLARLNGAAVVDVLHIHSPCLLCQ